jgi:hypothetical protein
MLRSTVRFSFLAVAGVALLGAAACLGEDARVPFVRVSPRDPRYLELSDGSPYIPIGLNLIHPRSNEAKPEAGLAQMDEWMKALSANGGNYIRVWLSGGFWEIEHEKAGVYDEEKAKRVDALLEMAKRYGIRVKFTVEHFREIDMKDVRQKWACKPLHHTANGGTAESMPAWFANESSRAQFRQKLAFLAKRYGDQPMVYGWELWNEINAVRGGDWRNWTESMLPEVRRLFPKNLALQSLGSFDGDYAREQYRWLCGLKDNGLAQVHRYLDLGARLQVCHGPMDVLAADAVRELLAFKSGKPVLLAESGAVEPSHAGPFKLYAKDKAGVLLHDVLFAPFFAGAAGTGQCWHWHEYVDANKLWPLFGRFAEAVKGIDPPAEGFEPLMVEHPRLRVYVLKGRRTSLVWCRDKENTWEAELAQGRAPEELKDLELALGATVPLDGAKVRSYDPWANRWSDAAVAGGTVRLPAFSRSIVVRVEAK